MKTSLGNDEERGTFLVQLGAPKKYFSLKTSLGNEGRKVLS